MPLRECSDDSGQPGVAWGDAGTCYTYDPADPASRKAAVVKAMKQAVAMGDIPGHRMLDNDGELRAQAGEVINAGERLLADALVDGVEEYGRYEAAAAQYADGAADGHRCSGCVFYRGDEYDPIERCVLVAAMVDPAGGCRLGIQGVLPGALEDEAPDEAAAEGEDETTLADALEDVDEALQLGDADEGDEEESEDEDEAAVVVNVSVNIDNDNASHNADNGSVTTAEAADDPMRNGPAGEKREQAERACHGAAVTWRDSGAGPNYKTIAGYAVVWGARSLDLGGFIETFDRGAFTDALAAKPDVRLLYSHDPAYVLARTSNGTLEVVEDEIGLRMWARVDMRDPHVQMVAAKLRNGTADQASFAFTVADKGETWAYGGDIPLRTVTSVDSLYELSIVAMPAYESTRVGILERGLAELSANSNGRALGRASGVAAADPSGVSSHGIAMGRDSLTDHQRAAQAKWSARLARKRKEANDGRQDCRGARKPA